MTDVIQENWGISGHEWAVEMLQEQIRRDSVRHAYLFCGPAGVGRRTLGIRFAQALDCPNPVAPGEPCGKCKTCQQIERMQYADLAVIQAEKVGGTLKVEQVRALRQTLSLKPYQGKFRVALFLRFEEANQNAANALLKTLEEAPAHVIIILTAESPEQLLPTISSRCEVLRLRPLSIENVEGLLKEYGADEAKAMLLAHISAGRPGYALHLLTDKAALEFREEKLQDLIKLLKASRVERFAYAENLTRRKRDKKADEDVDRKDAGDEFRQALQLWLSFWRDVLICRSHASIPLVNLDLQEQVEALAGRLSLEQVRKLVGDAEQAIDRLDRNVNARLLAEVLLLDWPHV